MLEDFDLKAPPKAPPVVPLPRVIDADTLDVHEEILENYRNALSLREQIAYDETVPANQRAQVLNTCTAILTQLTKLQTDLYNANRLKTLEQILVNVLKTQPDSIKNSFFEAYERELNGKTGT